MGKPTIINVEALIAAGIDPKTGLPLKIADADMKSEIKKLLRILDEQEFCNRYVWKNIPANISSQELERMLYYKGQLIMFFAKDVGDGEFFITPYSLDGGIDFYGRYRTVKPVPMSSGTDENDNKQKSASDAALLTGMKFEIAYTPVNNPSQNDVEGKAVILRDYTNQLPQTLLPRQGIQEAIIDVESECIPYAQTNMLASCGTKAVRVNNADQSQEVEKAAKSIKKHALNGITMTPIVGDLEMQELNDKSPTKSEEFMLVMQAVDNLRRRFLGINTGGVFEKKAHTLQSEQSMNETAAALPLADGLAWRKKFCMIANSIWGIGIDVDIAEELKQKETNEDVYVDSTKEGNEDGNDDTEVQ